MSVRSRSRDEEGFTLLELMVVILIIAILIAIAIPTYLGTVKRTKDRAAQSNLRNAMTAIRTLSVDRAGSFVNGDTNLAITIADLQATEQSLSYVTSFVDVGLADIRAISMRVFDDTALGTVASDVVLVTKSESGRYFCVRVTDQGRTFYAKGGNESVLNGSRTNCAGTSFDDAASA